MDANSADAAFRGGDYVSAVRQASPDSWQYWAARAMLGLTDQAVERLLALPDRPARAYAGVAAWMAGDDDRALAILSNVDDAEAARLRALIAKDRIDVLTQLPWPRAGSWDLVGSLRDPKFRLHNVSFDRRDLPNRPYADIHALVPAAVRPDFYVAQMVEWHLIPPNIRDLGCPLIGQSSDFDLHIQAVHPWLQLFDHLVACDSSEWAGLRSIAAAPVSTFAKSFGVPNGFPPVPVGDRPIDVFLSGTLFHPYQADKDATVRPLLRLDGLEVRIHSGFSSFADYFGNLGRSKISCAYIRHPGAMPTRALEALALGCAVAVQEESVLRLFADEDHGVIAYRRADDLPGIVERVVRDWDAYALRARRGAATIRRELSLQSVASHFFRFMTVLASRTRSAHSSPAASALVQKRPIVQKGWLPSYAFGGPVLRDWAAASVARLRTATAIAPSSRCLIDIAREVLLDRYHDPIGACDPKWLSEASDPLEQAIRLFPDSLVARANLVRVLLHFGGPDSVRRGIELLDETLADRARTWRIDYGEDVLPWDFAPAAFNYRRYFDAVVAGLAGADVSQALTDVLLASLAYYRSRYATTIPGPLSDIEYAAAAARRDPSFGPYVLWYCRLLLERGLPADCRAATSLLREHAISSLRVWELLDLCRRLPREQQGAWVAELERAADVLWRSSTLEEDQSPLRLRPAQACRSWFPAPEARPDWVDEIVRSGTHFVDTVVSTGATAVAAGRTIADGCVIAVPRDGVAYFRVRQHVREAAAGRVRCLRLDLNQPSGWQALAAHLEGLPRIDVLRIAATAGDLTGASALIREHQPILVVVGQPAAEPDEPSYRWRRASSTDGTDVLIGRPMNQPNRAAAVAAYNVGYSKPTGHGTE